MNMRINKWLALSSVALLLGAVACGDDETSTTTTGTASTTASSTTGATGGSGGMTAASTTASGMGGMAGPSQKCIDGCNDLWACTQEGDLCPGLKGADMMTEDAWKGGCTSDALCEGAAGLVDASDCPKTIGTISGLSADFKDSCANGIGGTGGAGGGK